MHMTYQAVCKKDMQAASLRESWPISPKLANGVNTINVKISVIILILTVLQGDSILVRVY